MLTLLLFRASPDLELFRFSAPGRFPPLLPLAVLPPPFRDEVDELDLGEKEETLLALPKLVFSRQLASPLPGRTGRRAAPAFCG